MSKKTDISQTRRAPLRALASLSCVLATWCALTVSVAQAQDSAAPAPDAAGQNEFDAMRLADQAQQPAAAADPIAALAGPPAAADGDVLITNQAQDGAAAPETPSADDVSAEASPAELTPVEDAATAQPPAMPSAVTQAAPVQQQEQISAPAAIQAPAAQAADADPLAPFRAQAQIKAAEQNRAAQQSNSANPLGPAGQLPVSSRATQSPEELQAQLDAEASVQQEKIKQQVFDTSLESLLPLTPGQTRSVLDSFRESRQAAETPIAVPKARTTVENVSLDPSQPPLSIKTSPGYVTTLTILDMTGAPWAIQDVSWAGKFEVTTPEEGGHVIRITPMSAHGVGNMSIRLVDLITPITFSIDTGLDVVDYRFDARIPKAGPLAKTPLIANGGLTTVAGTDENLMRVLDGTSVPAARRVALDGVDGATTAYSIDETMYLRTPLTLLSPSWQSSATSADGMNVYTLKTAPVILLSDKGRMVKARVKVSE